VVTYFPASQTKTISLFYRMIIDGYKIRDQSKPHFLTFTVVNWIDVFSREYYKNIIIESLSYCMINKGMIVYGYVIMSNHMHIIMQSEDSKLSNLIRDFKKFTSKKIILSLNNESFGRRQWMLNLFKAAANSRGGNNKYQLWIYGNHPEEIYSEKFLWSKLDYIHLNPVRARIVVKASHYIYSSAVNYVISNNAGVLPITCVDNPVIDVLKPNSFWKSISW